MNQFFSCSEKYHKHVFAFILASSYHRAVSSSRTLIELHDDKSMFHHVVIRHSESNLARFLEKCIVDSAHVGSIVHITFLI